MTSNITTMPPEIQALYLNFMIEKAKELVTKIPSQVAFDPQGRILVEFKLTDELLDEFLNRNNLSLAEINKIKISPTTTISLDISDIPELYQQYNRTLLNTLESKHSDAEKIIELLNKQPRGSIIALQQELHFHLALVNRVYHEACSKLENIDSELATAHQETMLQVNKMVMNEFALALSKSLTNDHSAINISTLNKELDKARALILPEAHSLLLANILKNTKIEKKTLKDAIKKAPKQLKKIAEETTATPNDLLHTDNHSGLVTWIAGSEHTAHKRIIGKEFAHRQILTLSMDTMTNTSPRLQIRTPSPVVKEGLTNDQEYIDDVAVKLQVINEHYQLQNRPADATSNRPRAFIYNSYTSINHTIDDWIIQKNKQTQSAKHILRGAHQYNKSRSKDTPPVYCFVQNIPVNRFGDSLGYGYWFYPNRLKQESTLMTELALIHTLYDSTPVKDNHQIKIDLIFGDYNLYITEVLNNYKPTIATYVLNLLRSLFGLKTNLNPPYFSETTRGKNAIIKLTELKQQWKEQTSDSSNFDDKQIVKNALRQLMAHDLHFTHEYAKLIQALSVYSEDVSLGGCKSGNERAQAINGRVAILDGLFKDKLTDDEKNLKASLVNLGNTTNVLQDAANLKSMLDNEYNNIGLQTAASLISLVDQGGPAKVETQKKEWYEIINNAFNTNRAEESGITNLSQKRASSMQAHKKLTKYMAKAFKGEPLDLASDLINQIGNYNKKDTPRINVEDFLKANQGSTANLYVGIDEYSKERKNLIANYKKKHPNNHYINDPHYFRTLFVAYVTGPQSKDFASLNQNNALANQSLKKITLNSFLTNDGAALYKLALQEEMNSKEYRDAVFKASLKHVNGKKWTTRMALIIAGPSASGKSFATEHTIKEAAKILGTVEEDNSGNDLLCIDGGVGRAVSQMRKLVIQVANKKGYSGIEDLHKQSRVLSDLREIMFRTALKSTLGIVIPETFSWFKPLSRNIPRIFKKPLINFNVPSKNTEEEKIAVDYMMQTLHESNASLIFSQVVGKNRKQFRKVVKFMGNKRAWKRDWEANYEKKQYDLNNESICESKAYGEKGFDFGLSGSNYAEKTYKEICGKNAHCLHIVNDLILLKPDEKKSWIEADRADQGTKMFSQESYNKWRVSKNESDLTKNPVLKIEIADTINTKDSTIKCDQLLINAIIKKDKPFLHREGITRTIVKKDELDSPMTQEPQTSLGNTQTRYSVDTLKADELFLYKVVHQHKGTTYKSSFTEEQVTAATKKKLERQDISKIFKVLVFPQAHNNEAENSEGLVAARLDFSLKIAHEVLLSMDKPATKENPLHLHSSNATEAEYLWSALLYLDQQNQPENRKVPIEAIKLSGSSFQGQVDKMRGRNVQNKSIYIEVFEKNKQHINKQVEEFKNISNISDSVRSTQKKFKEVLNEIIKPRNHATDTKSDNNSP